MVMQDWDEGISEEYMRDKRTTASAMMYYENGRQWGLETQWYLNAPLWSGEHGSAECQNAKKAAFGPLPCLCRLVRTVVQWWRQEITLVTGSKTSLRRLSRVSTTDQII